MYSPWSISEEKQVESLIGCFVSVISKENVKYNGLLHEINLRDCTLCIKKVICYGPCGTVDNQRDEANFQPPINFNLPLSNEVSDQMVFRGIDIKDLKIISQAEKSNSIIGHFVSLITKENVRVEGTLTHLNFQDKLVIVNNSYCYGSEGRRRRSEIKPCNELRGPISFRFRDIMDFEGIFLPEPQAEDCESKFPAITRTHMEH